MLSDLSVILLSYVWRLVFVLVRTLYKIIQHVAWHANGTCEQLLRAWEGQDDAHGAQVLDIVWRCSMDPAGDVGIDDFLCNHDSFISSDTLLGEHAQLYFLLDDAAVFARCDPAPAKSTKLAHAQDTLYRNASQLIVVPLAAMDKMAASIQQRKIKVGFVFSTGGRCDQVINALFSRSKYCEVVMEPGTFHEIARMYALEPDSACLQKVVTSVVTLLTSQIAKEKRDRMAIVKLPAAAIQTIPLLQKLFPSSKTLFIYENVAESSAHFCRVPSKSPRLLLCRYSRGRLTSLQRHLMADIGSTTPGDIGDIPPGEDLLGVAAVAWCLIASKYAEVRKACPEVACARLGDIIERPRVHVERVLKHMGLPGKAVESVIAGDLAGGSGAQARAALLDEARIRRVMKSFNMESLWHDDTLEGMIGPNEEIMH